MKPGIDRAFFISGSRSHGSLTAPVEQVDSPGVSMAKIKLTKFAASSLEATT